MSIPDCRTCINEDTDICGDCSVYRHEGGCSCHINPPCSFCVDLLYEQKLVIVNGAISTIEQRSFPKRILEIDDCSLCNHAEWDALTGKFVCSNGQSYNKSLDGIGSGSIPEWCVLPIVEEN